jgi:hypothetical protein
MATTTPNFGWPVPTSTDLVKDGATAIEGLGDAIDASLLDLKGGTTNQVLAKNSNTDMDFKWVADASGIPATIIDAKGDLIAGTAADTAARLAVGTNGQVLTADSTAATGLKWATAAGGGKVLQVVAATYSTQTSSSSSTFADTGLTATITPSSATSKVLVLVTQNGVRKQTNDTAVGIKLFRDATEIAVLATDAGDTSSTARNEIGTVGISLLNEPATTSAITYKTQFRSVSNNASAIVQLGNAVSSIVLLEIGA